MNNSRVSVIIPTRNRPDLVGNAVASVLAQTSPAAEVIVVDDASTTSYAEVMARYPSTAQTAVIYQKHETPVGGGGTRNDGAKIATGDILMFLDDDDTWTPEKIGGQLALFAADPKVGLVYSARTVVNHLGEYQYVITPKVQGFVHQEMLIANQIGSTSSVAVRRDLFWEAGGFDPEMTGMQDYDLWIRLSKLTKITFDPTPTVCWTVHQQNTTQMTGNPELYEKAAQRILTKYAEDFAALPSLTRRKAYAFMYKSLATTYARARKPQQYHYALRSLCSYPTLSALLYLIPYALRDALRALVGR